MQQNLKQGFAYHAELMRRMAGKLGLDLSQSVDEGRLSFAGVDDAVHRCMGCRDPEGCSVWMANRPGGAHEAPLICQNRHLFKRLS